MLTEKSLLEVMSPKWLPESYRTIARGLESMSPEDFTAGLRQWLRTDLWVLMRVGLKRADVSDPWLWARCCEVCASPNGHLDLWARGHYKSSIITFALTIQDILASHGDEPLAKWGGMEPTFGIFSHTRPAAKAFLRQIKEEFEKNDFLKALFPDVLWGKPESDAPRWSEDAGIVVRRRSNPKESTVEAWGLVDGMPTGKHFNVLLHDDTVTKESVSTPEMNAKTLEAWELSLNLGDRNPILRIIGTRYANADPYSVMLKREVAVPRLHPATVDGTVDGDPVFLTRAEFEKKWKAMGGGFVASAQLLLNPVADSAVSFKREWLRYYREASNWKQMTRLLLVDPASAKKKRSDYTAMGVLGLGPDGNRYLLDLVRDRLSLQERAQMAMQMHRKWSPQRVGWEKYGMMADIEYMHEVMERENYRFEIEELGGQMSKVDRINRLMPPFSEKRYYLPTVLWKTQYDGKTVDVIQALVEEELTPWPLPIHDDILDMMSREFDMEWVIWPKGAEQEAARAKEERRRGRYSDNGGMGGSWMSA